VACELPSKEVKVQLEGFIKACRHVHATPDQFQALRAVVTVSYPLARESLFRLDLGDEKNP